MNIRKSPTIDTALNTMASYATFNPRRTAAFRLATGYRLRKDQQVGKMNTRQRAAFFAVRRALRRLGDADAHWRATKTGYKAVYEAHLDFKKVCAGAGFGGQYRPWAEDWN